jgi:hypothetical protein
MSPLAATYFSAATGLLKQAYKTNRQTLQQLGPILGRTVAEGSVIHTFGSGHSEIIAREIVGRAGSLVCVSGIYDPTGGFIGNLAGYGTQLAERYDRLYGLRALAATQAWPVQLPPITDPPIEGVRRLLRKME